MENKNKTNKQKQIEQEITFLIKQCVYNPGDKLPSIRTLARQHNTSSSPVTAAYNSLVAQRWVESRPCSGYYVSREIMEIPEIRKRFDFLGSNSIERYDLLETMQSSFTSMFGANNSISYSFGSTPASTCFFACDDFASHMVKSIRNTPLPIDNLQIVQHDRTELKREIVLWLKRNNADFDLDIDTISIVRSVTDGTMLALRACAEPGSLVAVESPCHAGFYFSLKLFAYRALPVPSDPTTGLDVDRFEKMCEEGTVPSCLLLCSNFSNPTGAVIPDEQKCRLTTVCRAYDIPIIEDGIMDDLYYGKKRPRTLKSFDPENVIYISGFGKSLNPMIRLGYVSPGNHGDLVALQKHLMVAYANYSAQDAMISFLRCGEAYQNIFLFRKRLRMLKDHYRTLILQNFPSGTNVSDPQGGIYLWITLPPEVDVDELSSMAEKFGISISPARLFHAMPDKENAFRLNIAGCPWNEKSQNAVKTLGTLACSMKNSVKKSTNAAK